MIVAGSSAAASGVELSNIRIKSKLSCEKSDRSAACVRDSRDRIEYFLGSVRRVEIQTHRGGKTGNISLAAGTDKMKKNAEMTTNKATELTGGVTEGVKADGQANDIVKSNEL